MGNAIKNYQKKQRKESKEAYKELRGIVHNAIVKEYEKLGYPKELLKKEKEVFELIN